jgi:hypothetical protein
VRRALYEAAAALRTRFKRKDRPIVGSACARQERAIFLSAQLSTAFAQSETENDCLSTRNRGNLLTIMIGGGHEA